jgi:hypothetical protein
MKLRSNNALIAANEAQMRALNAVDEQVSEGIQARLEVVKGLNERLNRLGVMVGRVEDVCKGGF